MVSRTCMFVQIGSFMSDIADDFKIVVVEAIRSLCLKFPNKHRSLMNFLSSILREEGGFEYKRAIVDSILILIDAIPEAKASGLGHLCEFIEDCEFAYLSTQILHILGKEGPATTDPGHYIRFIYNRIILESATVRAAAVSSLAKFGAVEDLKPKILVLLRRALFDNDDEVISAKAKCHVMGRLGAGSSHALRGAAVREGRRCGGSGAAHGETASEESGNRVAAVLSWADR